MNFAIGRQDLFYEALEIGDRANRWCKKMNSTLLKAMQSDSLRPVLFGHERLGH